MRDAIIRKRYLAPGEETMDDVYLRVAKAIMPENAQVYYGLMASGTFLPNSPTLSNAGVEGRTGTLSACFVLPVYDSLDSIMKTATDTAHIHKSFGGTGFNFSNIRSRNSRIKSTGGTACGPVKVIELYNQVAETLAQGGKRSGANMAILNWDHQDIHEFINRKQTENLDHFNFSVGITDQTPDDLIVECAKSAWAIGCPGLIFFDEINRANSCPQLGDITGTNPCGESPLRNYESCNLGSINLTKFVKGNTFDFGKFAQVVRLAVRFLDSVIDNNQYVIDEIEEATKETRKIGLGIMGWADTLIMLNILYDSPQAIDLIDEIGTVLWGAAHDESHQLALEKGSFPAWEGSLYGMQDHPMRNATCTCIAPTGTISYLANCSSGIEPVFEWKVERTSDEGKEVMIHPLYDAYVSGTPHETQVAGTISPMVHLSHQATWQKYIDLAVSKTINMPHSATVDEVIAIYRHARDIGVKGITIYRDKSKTKQVLVEVADQPPIKSHNGTGHIVARPGITYEGMSGCGTIRLVANNDEYDEEPFETYAITGGGCEANNAAIGRLISGWIQDGGDPIRIAGILRKVKCTTALKNPKSMGKSCADIIGQCLEMKWGKRDETKNDPINLCPECSAPLAFGMGCSQGTCKNCGWSGCS